MSSKNTAVFGIYPSAPAAELAVDRLIHAGFSNDSISVLLPDEKSSRDFCARKEHKGA